MLPWHLELRGKFPALRSWTYLNTASAGPIALEVARAACEVYESLLADGAAGWEGMLALAEAARANLGELTGAKPREIAFTRSASHSVALIAQMLWDAGKRTAVALEDEFPASTVPFLNRGFDVRFVRATDGRYPLDSIQAALAGRDVLIASHVMYRTGLALDPAALAAVADQSGAHLLLNVTQSLGALPVDFRASGASFAVGTSHKWLCAGYGTGWLAMREELLGTMPWPAASWVSQREPQRMMAETLDLSGDARVMELGGMPFAPVLALGAAVRLWLATGPQRVGARIQELSLGLRQRLRDAGWNVPEMSREELSGITVVPLTHPDEVCQRLQEERIATIPRGAGLRLAVHAFNDERDLDRTIEALMRIRSTS